MMTDTVVRYRFWHLTWTDEREETWLRAMARQGLHLLEANNSIGRYGFLIGAPEDVVYRLYYRTAGSGQGAQQLADGGWERLADPTNWEYWRKPAHALTAAEIHPDQRSKAAMHQRLLVTACVSAWPATVVPLVSHGALFDTHHDSMPITYALLVSAYVTCAVLWVVRVVQLTGRIHHYKKGLV